MKLRNTKDIISFLNHFPMKWWILIYIIILLGHVVTIFFGYVVGTLGFLLSVVTYYIFLTKTKLWSLHTYKYSIWMFLIFLAISMVLMFTERINFYEICLLLGVYEFVLMFLFLILPLNLNKALHQPKINFIRNLLSIILLITSLYYIPLGLYGMYHRINPLNISGFIFPLYFIAVLVVFMVLVVANVFLDFKKEKIPKPKTQSFFLSETDKVDIGTIKRFFENHEIFLSHNFSMDDLAEQTGIERRRISHLINSGMNTNYYRLVAYYRIMKAKELLENESDFTVEYIASQCGFTSIPVFIKYFKIFTGTTPKVYRDSNLKSHS